VDAPQVGKLIDSDARRDAIHVAVAPVEAAEDLQPGQHVGLVAGLASGTVAAIGVVDPFLTEAVRKGQRFWLFLYPNTVTTLRHVWTHPAFMAVPPPSSQRGT
jgi:ABC-type nitrate/sulfonate/bicarbonate transport system substrate-binding protein